MSLFTVDGLATGLDTGNIIRQLMAVERQPQQRLQARRDQYTAESRAWADIETRLKTLRSTANDLKAPVRFNQYSATSSDEGLVTVRAGEQAAAGSLSFRVVSLAAAHQRMSSEFADGSTWSGRLVASTGLADVGVASVQAQGGTLAEGRYDLEVLTVDGATAQVRWNGTEQTIASSGTVTLTAGTGSVQLTIGGDGLQTGRMRMAVAVSATAVEMGVLATKVNNAGAGMTAQVVRTNDPGATEPNRFIVTSATTGAQHGLTLDISGLTGGPALTFSDLTTARDAELRIGEGSLPVYRSTNSFSDVVRGVTFDLQAADPAKTVTIGVDRNEEELVRRVKGFVDAVNDVLKQTDRYTDYDPETRRSSVLTGDARIRDLESRLSKAMQYRDNTIDRSTLGRVGIEVQTDGTYKLDESKLRTALTDDFDDVVSLLAEQGTKKGALGSVVAMVDELDEENGLLTLVKDRNDRTVRDLDGQLAAMDRRLGLVETRYRRQFSQLEVMIASMQSQGRYLSSQL